VGEKLGLIVGIVGFAKVGCKVGSEVGSGVGKNVGAAEGIDDGINVGIGVGAGKYTFALASFIIATFPVHVPASLQPSWI